MESIRDAQGFSSKTPITPSRGFSVETLTRVTLSWKTELNRSISAMEDGISRWLQHHHKMCYKKDGHHGRQACMIWRWLHHGDVVSGWVDLHITWHSLSLKTPPTQNLVWLIATTLLLNCYLLKKIWDII